MADLHLASSDNVVSSREELDTEQQLRAARRELRALERSLAAILASASVSTAQRAEFVGLLTYGGRRRRPDAAVLPVLSVAEQRLVETHRALDQSSKALLSHVASILAERDGLRQENEALRRKGKKGRA